MSDAIAIRPLEARDLPAAARLYVDVFNAPPWHDAWTVETAFKRLEETLATPGALGLVAGSGEPDGVLVGYMEQWFDGRHFYIKELFVQPDRQRSGVGSALMNRLEEILAGEGADRIYLLTEGESIAARFYARRGYYRSPKMTLMARRLVRPHS
jgi:ribosomal protein S18 acetylase RimI-like enzyme